MYRREHRHRGAGFLRRLEGEGHVLEPERELEGRRLEAPGKRDATVVLVDRRAEELARDQVMEGCGIDPVLAQQGEGLAQGFQHRADKEVACELDHARLLRRITKMDD